jgi:hypothetical protein
MEVITTALLIFILGCVVHLERQVASINTKVTRLEKNSKVKNNEKE